MLFRSNHDGYIKDGYEEDENRAEDGGGLPARRIPAEHSDGAEDEGRSGNVAPGRAAGHPIGIALLKRDARSEARVPEMNEAEHERHTAIPRQA